MTRIHMRCLTTGDEVTILPERGKKMRPFPKHYDFFLKVANQHNLTFPRGRALYMCNRKQNGAWFGLYEEPAKGSLFDQAQMRINLLLAMRSVRPSTAQRWFKHWNEGGHIKMISMSRDAYLARRRETAAKHKKTMLAMNRRRKIFDKLVDNRFNQHRYSTAWVITDDLASLEALSLLTEDEFIKLLEDVKPLHLELEEGGR